MAAFGLPPDNPPPMAHHFFDTLAYVKKLKAAGVPEPQAEAHAEAIADVIDGRVATKQDIYELKKETADVKQELKRDINELKKEISDVRQEIKQESARLEERITHKLTIRLGAMIVTATMVLGVLIKIL